MRPPASAARVHAHPCQAAPLRNRDGALYARRTSLVASATTAALVKRMRVGRLSARAARVAASTGAVPWVAVRIGGHVPGRMLVAPA